MSYKKAVEIYGEDKLVKLLNTKQILNILLPIIFPTNISCSFFIEEIIEFMKAFCIRKVYRQD